MARRPNGYKNFAGWNAEKEMELRRQLYGDVDMPEEVGDEPDPEDAITDYRNVRGE